MKHAFPKSNLITNMYSIVITIIIICFLFIIMQNWIKIPSKNEHITRNKHNVLPVGKLTLINNNHYSDDNGIIWIKRGFFASVFHQPFKNYTFETYDVHKQSSSEITIDIHDFDNGIMNYKPATYNFYSSVLYPLSHFFSDVLPTVIYLGPNYKTYNTL